LPEVRRLARKLTAKQAPASILRHLCSRLREILDARFCILVLIGETQQLEIECASGLGARHLSVLRGDPFDLSALAKLVPDLTPVRRNNVSPSILPPQLAAEIGPNHPFLGVRLSTPMKPHGILCIWGKAGGRFKESDAEIAASMAELAAIGYENALQRESFRGWESQFRLLSNERMSAREQERRRISQALHDDLGQDLTAINIELQLLGRRPPSDRSELTERLTSIASSVDNVIHQVRRIATDLRLPVLDLGLARAIRVHASQFQARTTIGCEVVADEDVEIDLPRAIAVFRVFQESLTNVARHSGATEVKVALWVTEESVILKVQDNGRGLGQNPPDPSSLGLLGMRERAAQFNGGVIVESRAKAGTTVLMSLPLT
jgi:signal transduction histidine kinase